MSLEKIKEFSHYIFNTLGNSYKEHIYVNAMSIHLRNENYKFQTEVIIPIMYEGMQLGYERADIIIYEPFNCIIEFKAQTNLLSKKELVQLQKYQQNLNIEDGLLINFGCSKNILEINESKLSEINKKIVSIDS
tara:strand:- start:99 stop:500 length:402 start_codon:yes stop_codon:yes gene_type:complete